MIPAKKILVLVLLVSSFQLLVSVLPAPSLAACAPLPEEACQLIDKLFAEETPGPWYSQTPGQFADRVLQAPENEIFGERYTYAQINWIINSLATMLNPSLSVRSSADLINLLKTVQTILDNLISDPGSVSLKEYAQLGPAGLFAGGMTSMYLHPPASATQEVKYLAEKIFDMGTGVQSVYAQGYGFTGLSSGGAVRSLWSATRNMAYLLSIILLIAAGFTIMFRVKINPQTVVTLQTMIPKLIITLVLITFSFAIAGLVIDLIYVFIAGFVGFMSLGGIMDDKANIGSVIQWLTTPSFLKYIWLQAPLQIVLGIFLPLIGGGVLSFIPGVGIGAGIIGAIIAIVVTIVLIVIFWKVFIMLLKSYIMLILYIIIGPLYIMLDLIPGQQGFGPWLRNLIAHASVFVVVPIMLFVQHVISWDPITNWLLHIKALGPIATGGLGGVNNLDLPYYDLAGSWGQGALGSTNFITRWILGFVIWSMTPKVAEIVRDALKIPPFKYGSAIGEAVQWFTKPTGAVIQGVGSGLAKRPSAGPVEVGVGTVIQNVGGAVSNFNTK